MNQYPIGTKVKVFTPSAAPFKFWGKHATVIEHVDMTEKAGYKSPGYLLDGGELGVCRVYARSVHKVS